MYTHTHLRLWSLPPYYFGASWPDHYVFLSRNRDSDTVAESNWRVAIARLEALPEFEPPEGEEEIVTRYVVRESHAACGWVEWIAIHKNDTAALEAADEMAARLENYPVLSDDDLSELEMEEADRVWKENYSDRERLEYVRQYRRQFDFRDFSDMLACMRGRYFSGYASELLY
jgi:hypothetical protein